MCIFGYVFWGGFSTCFCLFLVFGFFVYIFLQLPSPQAYQYRLKIVTTPPPRRPLKIITIISMNILQTLIEFYPLKPLGLSYLRVLLFKG